MFYENLNHENDDWGLFIDIENGSVNDHYYYNNSNYSNCYNYYYYNRYTNKYNKNNNYKKQKNNNANCVPSNKNYKQLNYIYTIEENEGNEENEDFYNSSFENITNKNDNFNIYFVYSIALILFISSLC